MNANFDNIADEQMLSATLLEAFSMPRATSAALAVGDRSAVSSTARAPTPPTPPSIRGSRGGTLRHPWRMAVKHVFPADGEYVFR
jgi:hypothetical protein